jgi:hypothetical protein
MRLPGWKSHTSRTTRRRGSLDLNAQFSRSTAALGGGAIKRAYDNLAIKQTRDLALRLRTKMETWELE